MSRLNRMCLDFDKEKFDKEPIINKVCYIQCDIDNLSIYGDRLNTLSFDLLQRFFKPYTENDPTTIFEYEQMYEGFINACDYMYMLFDYVKDLGEQLEHTSARTKALIHDITHKIENSEE